MGLFNFFENKTILAKMKECKQNIIEDWKWKI
jgi:hypothetical protein